MLLTMFETYISRRFSVAFIEMVTFNRKQVTTLFLKIRHQILAIKCKTIAHWYAHSSIHFYLQSNDLHIEGNVSYIMAVYIYCSNVALFVNKLSRLLCNRECVYFVCRVKINCSFFCSRHFTMHFAVTADMSVCDFANFYLRKMMYVYASEHVSPPVRSGSFSSESIIARITKTDSYNVHHRTASNAEFQTSLISQNSGQFKALKVPLI